MRSAPTGVVLGEKELPHGTSVGIRPVHPGARHLGCRTGGTVQVGLAATEGTARSLRGAFHFAATWRGTTRSAFRRVCDHAVFCGYVGGIVAAGIAMWIWAASVLSHGLASVRESPYILIFVALVLIAELRPLKWLRRQEGGEVTASWSFAAALLLIAPPQIAILTIALSSAVGDAVHTKSPVRLLFNAAQTSLSLAAGAAVLYLGGVLNHLPQHQPLTPMYLLVTVLGGVVMLGSNSAMTCIVMALHQRLSVRGRLRRDLTRNLSTDGMLLALAPIFVVVAQRSAILVPLLLLTAHAVHRSVRLALERQHEAMHDPLTDLPNRRLFDEQVAAAVAAAGRRRHALAVMMIDLDGFKDVNDRLGHHVGDLLLAAVGERLRIVARNSDLVARLGGDEFAVLSTGSHDREGVVEMADRLRAALHQPFELDGISVGIGGSFGIAFFPDNGHDPAALCESADAAMYQAKRSGAGVLTYDSLRHGEFEGSRRQLVHNLAAAIEQDELVLHYQPMQELQGKRIVAAEALVRWQHPTMGLVPPANFIPLAEQTDLIEPLSLAVLEMALRDAATWAILGHDLAVAVNMSARNLQDLRFPDTVSTLLSRHGLPAHRLDIEITENAFTGETAKTRRVLEQLREMGVTVSIDDFGTGYSSLSHLLELPVDALKIDRSFVAKMAHHREAELIVRSVIGLAKGLGLRTVAEGVEDAEVQRLLLELGCDRLQGFYLARPLPNAALLDWLDSALPPALWAVVQ